MARNLVLLVVGVASEAILHFVTTGVQTNWSATLDDFAIWPMELREANQAG